MNTFIHTFKGFCKVRFTGTWWKVSLILNLARLLGLKVEYFSAGTGEYTGI